jgi:hypothetical protein
MEVFGSTILTLVVGAILGAVLGAWFTTYIKRPKLAIAGAGGGGGPGPGHHERYVRIQNQPGLMGFRLNETVILGKLMHDRIEKGLTVERVPANDCTAQLLDKESGRHVAQLFWRVGGAADIPQPRVTIRSGESFDLLLFVRLHDESAKYFVYRPSGDELGFVVPSDEAKLADTRAFVVQVTYSYGRQKLKFDVTVRKDFDGRLYVEGAGGGGSF